MPFSRGGLGMTGGSPSDNKALGDQQSLENILGAALRQQDLQTASTPLGGPQAEITQTAGLFDFLGDIFGSLNPFSSASDALEEANEKAPKKTKAKSAPRKSFMEQQMQELLEVEERKKKRDQSQGLSQDQLAAMQQIFGGFV